MNDSALKDLEERIHKLIIRTRNVSEQNRQLVETNVRQQMTIKRLNEEIVSLREKIDFSVENLDKTISSVQDWLESKKR